jgi:hypothetical protein
LLSVLAGNFLFRGWTDSNDFDAKDENDQDVLIDTSVLNEAIETEFWTETIPQSALVIINSILLKRFTLGAIVLLSGSSLFSFMEFWKIIYFRFIDKRKISYENIPLDKSFTLRIPHIKFESSSDTNASDDDGGGLRINLCFICIDKVLSLKTIEKRFHLKIEPNKKRSFVNVANGPGRAGTGTGTGPQNRSYIQLTPTSTQAHTVPSQTSLDDLPVRDQKMQMTIAGGSIAANGPGRKGTSTAALQNRTYIQPTPH